MHRSMNRSKCATCYIAHTPRPAALTTRCAVALTLVCCATTPRLDANFDTASVSAAPPSNPPPTPPNDSLNWRAGATTVSVLDSGGERWVRVAPVPTFTAAPDQRAVFLIAVSEHFSTSPPANIRGSIRLRLDGCGTVGVGLRPLQGEQTLDFIGGFELSNLCPGNAAGSVHGVQAFTGARLADPFSLPSSGPIASYRMGTAIDVFWTIDQASRTYAASVLDGPLASAQFPAVSGSVATTPIQRLLVYVWLAHPTFNTALFVKESVCGRIRVIGARDAPLGPARVRAVSFSTHGAGAHIHPQSFMRLRPH
jgi:hypothetical protein